MARRELRSGQEGNGNPMLTRGIQLPLSCGCFYSLVSRLLFRASFSGSDSGSREGLPKEGKAVVSKVLVPSGGVYKMELGPQAIWQQPLTL